ncbi:brachyurin-like [Neocloeon triangulifer]|uniref:brachyurin-like n=1 Tax=Neocloeon triangulifer TaxID=2078957 RepID=UPI00286F794D|nr:brachyurin-like [Neocloeon triangulifer]
MRTPVKLVVVLTLSAIFGSGDRIANLQPKRNLIKIRDVEVDEDVSHSQPKIDYVNKGARKLQTKRAGVSFQNVTRMITGGTKAGQKMFPWVFFLIVDNAWLCGGSLISSDWGMTAAHCVDGGYTFSVNVGGIDRSRNNETGEKSYTSTKAIVHKDYNKTLYTNDIALIAVSFKLSQYVNVIRLPPYSYGNATLADKDAYVAGYGLTADGGSPSRYLMYAVLKTMKNIDCVKLFGDKYVISSTICIAPDIAKSACFGDSGNTLKILEKDGKFTAIGIVSAGPDICVNYLSTCTRVTSFLGWISQQTGIKILNDRKIKIKNRK